MRFENGADERSAKWDAAMKLNMVAEGGEGTIPPSPLGQHGLELRPTCAQIDGGRSLFCRLQSLSAAT
jgi:hypothetical protein